VILILGVTISSLSQLALLLLQCQPTMSPFWYYLCESVSGVVSWVAVSLSALSDVMPPQWRAASFGMILAGFSLGFSMAPFLALWLGHFSVSVLSLTAVWAGLSSIVFFFPETLPPEIAVEASAVRAEQMRGLRGSQKVLWWLYRPIWELSILNRNRLFRLLSCLAFCSGMVSSGE
jgi:MFS family permease